MVAGKMQQKNLGHPLTDVAARFAKEEAGRLHERVYHTLRYAILAGILLPGNKVTEAELSTVLHLSRTPIREAFRRLESDGLVAYSPSRGVVVEGLSRSDLVEIYQMLESLEALAARLAAERISQESLSKLRDHLDLMQFYAERERWDEVTDEGIAFHRLVYETSGNARLCAYLLSLREYVRGARASALRAPGRGPISVVEHVQLYEALAARDPDAAAEIAGMHVRHSSRYVFADETDAMSDLALRLP